MSIQASGLKHVLAGGVSFVGLLSAQHALAQAAAQSDQPAASESSGLEEIVVTARRREEKAQNVPIAMDIVTATQLEQTVVSHRVV